MSVFYFFNSDQVIGDRLHDRVGALESNEFTYIFPKMSHKMNKLYFIEMYAPKYKTFAKEKLFFGFEEHKF